MEQIQNANELRTAVTLLTANVNNMCNTNDIDEAINKFYNGSLLELIRNERRVEFAQV